MQSGQIQFIGGGNIEIPVLTTEETNRLRADYPSIEHLEAGNIAPWLMERQDQLLVRAKDERAGMNLAKLITLAGGTVGAVCYATSPLALIGGVVAGVGYAWAIAQDLNDCHQFAPLPFVRGNFLEFLTAMGDKDARDEWFASQNEIVDLMNHLVPMERYEFGMLKVHAHTLTDFLGHVDAGKKFYAYRWLLDWFINLKGEFPSNEMLYSHLSQVTADPRVNYDQVGAIASHLNSTQRIYSAANTQALKPTPELLNPSLNDKNENNQNSEKNPLDSWLDDAPSSKTVEAQVVAANTSSAPATFIDTPDTPSSADTSLHSNSLIDQVSKVTLKCLEVKRAPCEFIEAIEGYKFNRILFRKLPTTNIDAVLNADRDIFCEIGRLMPELNKPPMVSQVRGGRIAVDIPKPEKDWTTALFKNYIVPAVRSFEWPVNLIVGVNLDGALIEMDISQDETCGMIVAGLPGGGKSAWLVAALCGLICQYTPDSVRLILSDTKRVELAPFGGIPHLFMPVAHTVPETVEAINAAIEEMERRKLLFVQAGVRNLAGYNNKVPASERLPRILVIIEESATVALSEETYVGTDELGNEGIKSYAEEFNKVKTRVKKEARFAGIYIIDSTQAPRREVLQPNYRGQFSCFLAFRCSRPEESKIALANQYEDACKLLGKGDGLYLNHLGLERIQSLWVTDPEVEAVVSRVISTYGTYADWVNKERKRTQESRKSGEISPEVTNTSPNGTKIPPDYEREIPVSNPNPSPNPNFNPNSSPSFNPNFSPNPSEGSHSTLEDYLLIRGLRGDLSQKPLSKGDIIKDHWNYSSRDWEKGCDRYKRAIDEHGADWIRELRTVHRLRISEIVKRVYAQNRKPAEEYQPYANKVREILGDYDTDDDSIPTSVQSDSEINEHEGPPPHPTKPIQTAGGLGATVWVAWSPVDGEVPGVILNRRQVGRGKGARTEFLITTPLGIRWTGKGRHREESAPAACVRPKPGIIKMSALPEEYIEEYLGAWRFIFSHPDIAAE